MVIPEYSSLFNPSAAIFSESRRSAATHQLTVRRVFFPDPCLAFSRSSFFVKGINETNGTSASAVDSIWIQQDAQGVVPGTRGPLAVLFRDATIGSSTTESVHTSLDPLQHA